MPDLKTELATKVLPVINNLDDLTFDDKPSTPDSKTKQVFDCVKQFGPCTADIVATKLGIEPSGVHARLRSLLQRQFIQRAKNQPGPYLYAALRKEYVVMSREEIIYLMNERRNELKESGQLRPRKKKLVRPLVERRHDVMSYPTPKAPPAPTPSPTDDIDTFINSLTVADAVKLRNKLNEMFGLS